MSSDDDRSQAALPAIPLATPSGPELIASTGAATADRASATADPATSTADAVLAQIGLTALPVTDASSGASSAAVAAMLPAASAPLASDATPPAGAIAATPVPSPLPGVAPLHAAPASLPAATAAQAAPVSLPSLQVAPDLPQTGAAATTTTASHPSTPPLPAAPTSAPLPSDGFAALATADTGRDASTFPAGFDTTLQTLDAPPLPTSGVAMPAMPLRTEVTTALPSLGSIAMPAAPELGFDDSFDQRIAWMADQRIAQAELRVSPDGLGPIEVRLQIEGHRVTAQFSAANADVRQALESGMDRLRDLLGERGMELADAQVGRQGTPHGHGGRGQAPSDPADSPQEGATTTVATLLRARGLVDEYA